MGNFNEKQKPEPELIPRNLIEFERFTFFDQDLKSIEKFRKVNPKSDTGVTYTILIDTKSSNPKEFSYNSESIRDENYEALCDKIASSALINRITIDTVKDQKDEEE